MSEQQSTNESNTPTTPESSSAPAAPEAPQASPAAPVAPPSTPDTQTAPSAPADTKSASEGDSEGSESVSLDSQINGLVSEFLSNDGNLTDEQREQLTDTGFSDELFLALANGVQASQQANDQKVFESVGGEEVYQSMLSFAESNLSEAQVEAYNNALFSGDQETANLAILGLKAMMEGANKEPQRKLDASGNMISNSAGFSSQAELLQAMSNRRYGKDINYTQEVDAQRAKSPW